MGKRGPTERPTALKLLHGESRPSRVNYNEPEPAMMEPDCPEWFQADARIIWDRTVYQLRVMGILAAADQDALVVYCQAVAKYNRAVKMIDNSDLLIKGRDGTVVKNPAVQMMRDYGATVKVMAAEFGLTPSARAGLTTNEKKPSNMPGPERLLS